MVNFGRVWRHMVHAPWSLRAFPAPVLSAIEAEIAASERTHSGELRVVIEAALPLPAAWRDVSARERAAELFARLRVWDTEHNSGVLVYLLLADHSIEILADRGIAARVEQGAWDAIAAGMRDAYRGGAFERGTLDGIRAISALLAQHFPPAVDNPDELPNRPLVLG